MFDVNYWYWNGVLPIELCDTLILEGDKLISGDGTIGGTQAYGGYDPKVRETNISFFDSYHWIHGICIHYANIANQSAGWNLDISYPQNVQYARYFPDQYYTPHTDDNISSNKNEMRKLSVAIQISDGANYEGGDFIIESPCGKEFQCINEFRNRGSIIVFPSVITHGITPITKGVRHSIVCWVVGPKFR